MAKKPFDINAPLTQARHAFLAGDFRRADEILPGLDTLAVLGFGATPELLDKFVDWARIHRPNDLFLTDLAE